MPGYYRYVPPGPSQFHYSGPFHDGFGRSAINFPWDRLTGEPLIYASMGTLQNGVENVFNTIAEAVGTRPGFQLVLSVGPVIDPGALKSLPDNTIVVNRAPQLDLLKRSALCITHAGLNTTLESLTQGVPMVAIPVTNDQPGVAARIAYTETGRFLPLHQLAVPGLSSLHTDADLGRDIECFTDMTKSRELGFPEYKSTLRSFLELFERLRADRIIP